MVLAPDTVLACPLCGEEFTGTVANLSRGRHMKAKHSMGLAGVPVSEPPEDSGASTGDRLPPEGDAAPAKAPTAPPTIETPPTPKRPTLWERVRSRGRGKAGGGPVAAPASGERAPKRPRGKRIPLDTDISDIWGFLGRRLEATPHYPTGRMLQYQAPASGLILDRAIANTLPDRLIFQPLARGRNKWEDAAFLVAGPLVTFGLTRTMQEMQILLAEGRTEEYAAAARKLEIQFEAFDWLLAMMLPRLAEGKKKAEEKKAKTTAVVLDAFPELSGSDMSPSQLLRDMLFAPPTWNGVASDGQADSDSARDPAQDPMAL